MPTSFRYRWFQFSISGLLLITTIVAVWLGWELAYIRKRQAWIGKYDVGFRLNAGRVPDLPVWRKWLGDEPVELIFQHRDWTDADRATAIRLFPEAEIMLDYDGSDRLPVP